MNNLSHIWNLHLWQYFTGCYITKTSLASIVSPTKHWDALLALNSTQFLTPLLKHGRQSWAVIIAFWCRVQSSKAASLLLLSAHLSLYGKLLNLCAFCFQLFTGRLSRRVWSLSARLDFIAESAISLHIQTPTGTYWLILGKGEDEWMD